MRQTSASPTGRPRDPQAGPRVLAATLRLLASHGYAALRIDDVARESGVAKTTIYRRWRSLDALVLDAVDSALGERVIVETGDARADLLVLWERVHDSLVANPVGWELPAIGMAVMADPELGPRYRARFIEPVRRQAARLVEAAVEAGTLPGGLSSYVLVDAVARLFVFRRIMGEPPPGVEALGALLPGLGAPGDDRPASSRPSG